MEINAHMRIRNPVLTFKHKREYISHAHTHTHRVLMLYRFLSPDTKTTSSKICPLPPSLDSAFLCVVFSLRHFLQVICRKMLVV